MIKCSDFVRGGIRCNDPARWTSNGWAICDTHCPRVGRADIRALMVEIGPSRGGPGWLCDGRTSGAALAVRASYGLVRGELGQVGQVGDRGGVFVANAGTCANVGVVSGLGSCLVNDMACGWSWRFTLRTSRSCRTGRPVSRAAVLGGSAEPLTPFPARTLPARSSKVPPPAYPQAGTLGSELSAKRSPRPCRGGPCQVHSVSYFQTTGPPLHAPLLQGKTPLVDTQVLLLILGKPRRGVVQVFKRS